MRFDSQHASALDTLRLTRSQQRDLHQQLRRRGRVQPSHEARQEPRFEFDSVQGLIVEVYHPGGTNSNFLVQPRNLSSRGIGFLHGSFLHNGTECNVWLRAQDGKLISVLGAVARCQWICGRVHEIGVSFDAPIVLDDYLPPKMNPTDDARLSIPLPSVDGRLMYLCDSDQAQHTAAPMAGMGLTTQIVATAEQALVQLQDQAAEMVLVDLSCGLDASAQAIVALREVEFTGPILVLHDNDDATDVQKLRDAGASAVLTRPLTGDKFINALETFEATPADDTPESSPDASEKQEQPAESAKAAESVQVQGVMQAMLSRMRDYVKQLWDRFTQRRS